MSLLIVGGTVVTAEGTLDADVVVEGEKIAYLLPRNANIGFTGSPTSSSTPPTCT